jgi:micrococcal nuclease
MRIAVAARLAGVALLGTLAAALPAHAQASLGPAYVTRVVDGDTVYAEIGGRLEVVRYLGVNTPRIEHPAYGPAPYAAVAREVNRRLVEGRWIRLVFDGPSRDPLGRLQAYVWVGDVFVNAVLAHYGYAEAAAGSRAGYATYFRELQDGAQRAGRGIWRDPEVATYHRPRATELAADARDGDDLTAGVAGGRVFSAPAPFIPSSPTTGSGGPSPGVPSGPTTTGSPSYIVPRGSMRTTP